MANCEVLEIMDDKNHRLAHFGALKAAKTSLMENFCSECLSSSEVYLKILGILTEDYEGKSTT